MQNHCGETDVNTNYIHNKFPVFLKMFMLLRKEILRAGNVIKG